MLQYWYEEAPHLLSYLCRLFGTSMIDDPLWVGVAQGAGEEYQSILGRLADVGNEMIARRSEWEALMEPHTGQFGASENEQASFHAQQVRPVCEELVQILSEARTVLPFLYSRYASSKLQVQGQRELDWASLTAHVECVRQLRGVEGIARSMGVPSADRQQRGYLNLLDLVEVLGKTLPGATYPPAQEGGRSIEINGAPDRCSALVMAIGRAMSEIAENFREQRQELTNHINPLDLPSSLDGASEELRTYVGIVLRGDRLGLCCDGNHILRIGIPVRSEDYQSLTRLRDQVASVIAKFQDLLREFSIDAAGVLLEENNGVAEYTLSLTFTERVTHVHSSPGLSDYFRWRGEGFGYILREREARSFRWQTSLGTCSVLINEGGSRQLAAAGFDICQKVANFVGWLGTTNLGVFTQSQPQRRDGSEGGDYLDGAPDPEIDQDASEQEHFEDGHEHEPSPVCLFKFSNDQLALQDHEGQSTAAVRVELGVARAIAQRGIEGAARPLAPPQVSAPCTEIIVSDEVLRDPIAVSVLEELAEECKLGLVDLTCSPTIITECLPEAHSAVRNFKNQHPNAGQLWISFGPVRYDPSGRGPELTTAGIWLRSPSGQLMAEGIYLPGERRFDMIAVPLSVIDPLAEALARTTCEQINSEGVLRIVAFSKSLNGHGFDIADALLVDIVSRLKAVENAGRCVEELTGELRELLPEILVRARIRPIKEESGVWSILTDEDVPLQKRGKRFAWLVDDEEL